ncbi:MAG: cell envelope integrity protein TolA [Gammaproteobacteria bacterium]|nr:cell envelope integrity protein TolA [Gammaproteobacteria bacterium]MBU1625479.1 cell envelope integrity protein TolA [Gammaproteobacteria bacterium]MBU1980739.1 cell envelope integrity protein TolA [Gammaproteobacteria bacterium]
MSATLRYRDPYRFSAGMLAMVVHIAFFAMLVMGVRWQTHQPDRFSVELWDNLPMQQPTEEPAQQPAEAPVQEIVAAKKVVEQQASSSNVPQKADIELRDKKLRKPIKPQPSAKELRQKQLRQKQLREEQRVMEAYVEKQRLAERERVRAEVLAATSAEMGRYQDMIRSKIRHNIVMPPDVLPTAAAEFQVTLLPDGSVLDAVLRKSSGNAAYDEATERAIYKAQPLPIPSDPVLKKRFRELRLTIRPEDR